MIDINYIRKYRIIQFVQSGFYGLQETRKMASGSEYWETAATDRSLEHLRLLKQNREAQEAAKFIIIE